MAFERVVLAPCLLRDPICRPVFPAIVKQLTRATRKLSGFSRESGAVGAADDSDIADFGPGGSRGQLCGDGGAEEPRSRRARPHVLAARRAVLAKIAAATAVAASSSSSSCSDGLLPTATTRSRASLLPASPEADDPAVPAPLLAFYNQTGTHFSHA